ncbi:MAG: hypothetical protein A2580_09320 [Hydrogenophilales bacterium RIFOXYD1_FULL_62_11]|nr:MAG: hypothetical protein A2580_09320 [Hydrogenophilales bacterium RIFOXYD1_FULL_62_11]
MKHVFFAAVMAVAVAPSHAADVGISVSIGQPGFYGQIDIGGFPPPRILYREPMIIERVTVQRPPVYLHVPPGHAKNWSKHCREYNACGERVYFVQDSWYQNEYVPRYQKQHRGNDDKRGNGHGNSKNNKDNGHGNKNGHGSNH